MEERRSGVPRWVLDLSGGAAFFVLNALVIPLLIEQYPEFFRANPIALPLAVGATLLLLTPFAWHHSSRFFTLIHNGIGRKHQAMAWIIVVTAGGLAGVALSGAGYWLYLKHTGHILRSGAEKVPEAQARTTQYRQQDTAKPEAHQSSHAAAVPAKHAPPMASQPRAVTENTPEITLIERAVQTVQNCNAFQNQSQKKWLEARRRVEEHNSQPNVTVESKASFSQWAFGNLEKEDMQIYQQIYKHDFMEVRRLLGQKVPDSVEGFIDYENPANMGGVSGICGELRRLAWAYIDAQQDQGKITREQAKKYLDDMLPRRPDIPANIVSQTGQNNIAQIGNNNQATITVPASRVLSPEQQTRFFTELSKATGTIRVLTAGSSDDIQPLVNQICAIAQKAQWTLACPQGRNSTMGAQPEVQGIECYAEDWNSPDARAFKAAMDAVGLQCRTVNRAFSFGGMQIYGTSGVTVLVGRH